MRLDIYSQLSSIMVLTSSDTLIDQPKKDKKSMPAPTIIKK
jgi:hypothetical protein